MRLLIAAAFALALFAFPALAQEVAVPTEPSFLQQIVNLLAPAILSAVGVLALLIVNSAANFVKDKFGLDIEQSHRDALHSALLSGIRLALVKLGWIPGTDVPPQALSMAVSYAHRSVPDAIANLKPTDAILIDLAESKVPEATAEVAASGPEAVQMAGDHGRG